MNFIQSLFWALEEPNPEVLLKGEPFEKKLHELAWSKTEQTFWSLES